MKLKNSLIVFLILIFSSLHAQAEKIISQIFPVGGLAGKPQFIQTTEIDRGSDVAFTSKAKIVDSQGRILMTETVVVKDGKLVSQSVEQLQVQEAWDLEVQGKKATYRSFKMGSERKVLQNENAVVVGENFINGPMIEVFISKYWQELLAGKTLKAEFSVLELEKPVSFSFSKQQESVREGKKVVVVKMAPANFVISMFVTPLILEFDMDRKRLVYFKGRTPLKEEGNRNKPFDAEIIYQVQ